MSVTPRAWKNEKGPAGLFDAKAVIDLEERLQRGISAAEYGVKADGASDDTAALVDALEMGVAETRDVILPAGVIMHSGISLGANGVRLLGAGKALTTLRLIGGSNTNSLSITGNGTRVTDLTIDGQRASNTESAGHGLRLAGEDIQVERVRVEKTRTYGIALAQSASQFVKRIRIRDVDLAEIGRDGIDCKDQVGGNKALFLEAVSVESFGLNGENGEAGIDLRGPWHVSGVEIAAVDAKNVGIRFRDGDAGETGFGCAGGTLDGFSITCLSSSTQASGLILAAEVSASNGFVDLGEGVTTGVTNQTRCVVEGVRVVNGNESKGLAFWAPEGAKRGEFIGCVAYECQEGFRVNGENFLINGGVVEKCTTGVNPGNEKSTSWETLEIQGLRYKENGTDIKNSTTAAAEEVVLPGFTDAISVAGATEIKKIKASRARRRITLIFSSNPKVADGNNLKLAGPFEPAADSTLSFSHNGTNYFELSRSKN